MKRGSKAHKGRLAAAGVKIIPLSRIAIEKIGEGVVQGRKFLRRAREVRHNKPAVGKSLRLRLVVFFSIFLAVAWLIAAVSAWKEAKGHIDEFFDTQQMVFAKTLATIDFSGDVGALPRNKTAFPGISKKLLGAQEDDALGFAVFTLTGKRTATDGKKGRRFTFDPNAKGFSNTSLAGKKDVWRIVRLNSADGKHIVAVGQEMEYRQKMALDMLGKQILPWLLLLPILVCGFIALLSRELAPLRAMAKQLRARSPEDATLLNTDKIPSEAMPMAESLNSFIFRTNVMLARERSFVSDAAHELRTPLAGLRVQAQVASQEGIAPNVREEALQFLRLGIDRCSRMIEQLLALSRLEAQTETTTDGKALVPGLTPCRVEWAALLDEALQECRPKLDMKQIRLDCRITSLNAASQGRPTLIAMMVRNLLDNAANYAPCGGHIRVRLEKQRLRIENDAIKLPKEYAARLGERFFRPPGQEETGSGLGLSIVKRIAEIHAFALVVETLETAENPDEWTTFRVDVSWRQE